MKKEIYLKHKSILILENLGKVGFCFFFDDIVKADPVVGTAVGSIIGCAFDLGFVTKFGHNCKNYFESKFLSEEGEKFFVTRIKQLGTIFRQLEELRDKYD